MVMNHKGEQWPYHESKNGEMVACKSNPCRLHGGSDIMASSPEEAYAIKNQSDGMEPGLTADTDASFINLIDSASYDDIADSKEDEQIDVDDFIRNNIDSEGMMITDFKDDHDAHQYIHARQSISSYPLSDADQSSLIAIVQNKDYMKNALKDVDYNKMPAATEIINDLAFNPSTSGDTLEKITDVAVARRNNDNFPRQVYISDIANHSNLREKDAMRLYKAYPEECVKAQHFSKDIINSVLMDETAPDRVKAIAITNPNASVSAMSKAIRDGGETFRAQAMLNPNGKYLNIARKERKEKLSSVDDGASEIEHFNKSLQDRTGISI